MTTTPAHLRAWLRARVAHRRRWCGFKFRNPEWLQVLETMERAEARRRKK